MILNNFLALEFVRAHLGEELTPAFICGVHRIVTDGTLDEAEDAGRLQHQGEERIRIYRSEARISCCMFRRQPKNCLNDSSVCATLPMAWGSMRRNTCRRL